MRCISPESGSVRICAGVKLNQKQVRIRHWPDPHLFSFLFSVLLYADAVTSLLPINFFSGVRISRKSSTTHSTVLISM